MHSDFLELLQLLNIHKVRYLVIGGYAYGFHVEPRYTKDIDIWIEASKSNATRVLKVLDIFGAPVDNLTIKDLAIPGLIYIFGVPPMRVDILNRVSGGQFSSAYKNRTMAQVGKISIPIVNRKDLIRMKQSAGRTQDRADLEKLLDVPDSGTVRKSGKKKVRASRNNL